MKKLLATTMVAFCVLALPNAASAGCQTHRCWQQVHKKRVLKMVQKRINAITPYRCYGDRSVIPCNIIGRESKGDWTVLNTWTRGVACHTRACGYYQFLDKPVPWPVIVKSRYETLKRMLAHHRMARYLWFDQLYRGACHWC